MLKLARKTTERSPERAALAAAIEVATAADQAAGNQRAAVERARAAVTAAQARLDNATARAGQARIAATDGLVLAATNGTAAAEPTALRQARHDTIAAQDDVDLAQAALTRIEAELPDTEHAAERARKAVADAANDVLRSSGHVARMLAETAALQAQLIEKRRTLLFLFRAGLVDDARWAELNDFLYHPSVPAVQQTVHISNRHFSRPDWTQPDVPAAWGSAYSALMADAEAPLPDGAA